MSKINNNIYPHDFDEEIKMAEDFIKNFKVTQNRKKKKKYIDKIQKVLDNNIPTLEIYYEDLEDYFAGSSEKKNQFLKGIQLNTKRYTEMFTQVANGIQEIQRQTPLTEEEQFDNALEICRLEKIFKTEDEKKDFKLQKVKRILQKKFDVIIVDGQFSKKRTTKLRDLKAAMVGSRITVNALVVKTSEVMPMIDLACYICENCQWECYKKVSSKIFNPPIECNSKTCHDNRTQGNLVQNFAMSKFISYQEMKIQELTGETPVGQIPKTVKVFIRGEEVRKCSPGDLIEIQGIFLSEEPQKQNIFRDNLIQDTVIQASKIIKIKQEFEDIELSGQTEKKLRTIAQKQNYMDKLINSIAPEIYGLKEIKKSLLLQMVGGTNVVPIESISIKGDLNIALIGDPGVAKSQLLKFITGIIPRGIYTTGKGSSGAGLTASITRDPVSSEITLEGGALVLADQGICCIDEFDKMDDFDRVAIHEVMEQQTVSLAKAGITTRLNARTSILAAANPIYGRYDLDKSPHENINLPYSLLSRFDLIFILLDYADVDKDYSLANHLLYVHRHHQHPQKEKNILSQQQLRNYISLARQYNPLIPKELHEFLINKYLQKRKLNLEFQNKKEYTYITPRTLLGLIRLSQAFAKLRFSKIVSKDDVQQAIKLMDNAHQSMSEGENQSHFEKMKNIKQNKTSLIFKEFRKHIQKNKIQTINKEKLENFIISKGFSVKDFNKTIEDYQQLGLIIYNKEKNEITAVQLYSFIFIKTFFYFCIKCVKYQINQK